MFHRIMASSALVAVLAGCGDGNSVSFSDSDQATVGGYDVKWSDASAFGKAPGGLTPLMFIITPAASGGKPAPLDERVRLAQAALATSKRCAWAGFDPALNARNSSIAGAAESTLYALAKC